MVDEWLTIAQAAQRLGLAERQARRYADRLPDTDRTIDRTPAGRERTLVRLSALSKAAQKAGWAGHAPDVGPDTRRTQETVSVPLALAMTAQREAMERVISEKDARIADLQASLDHERQQSQQLTQALAREQTLRALSAPAPDVPPEGMVAPEASPSAHDPPPEPATATIWERLGLSRRKPMRGSGEDGVK